MIQAIAYISCGLALLSVALILARRPHRHIYEVINVQIIHDGLPFGMTNGTIALMRCKCGAHTAEIFPGLWTIHDFARKGNEISELERMAKL